MKQRSDLDSKPGVDEQSSHVNVALPSLCFRYATVALSHTSVTTGRAGDRHSFAHTSHTGGMATLERPREVPQSLDPLLTTAIPTPFPRALLQSLHTQQEDIVRPATAPATSATNLPSAAERPTQTVQREPTKGEMVSTWLGNDFRFPGGSCTLARYRSIYSKRPEFVSYDPRCPSFLTTFLRCCDTPDPGCPKPIPRLSPPHADIQTAATRFRRVHG